MSFAAFSLVILLISVDIPGDLSSCGVRPDEPNIPDGNKATYEELTAAHNTVDAYGPAIRDYFKCVRRIRNGAFKTLTIPQKKEWTRWFDREIQRSYSIPAAFNYELSRFKARRVREGW